MGIVVTKDEADKKQFDPFHVKNKKDGYRYRLLNKNSRNLERRLHEGFEIVQGDDPEHLDRLGPASPMKKGADVDSTRQFNDTVLARIPEELAKERDRKVKAATQRQTGLARSAFKSEVGDAAFDESKGEGGETQYNKGRLG